MDISIGFEDVWEALTEMCPNAAYDYYGLELSERMGKHSYYETCELCECGRVFKEQVKALIAKTMSAPR